MIWFTLIMFVVSFLVTAFLTPKPEFEDARASQLKDVNFPRATEDAPIPLVLGKVRMDAPNTVWYGDFLSKPIKEKIKTGLFSSTKIIVGYRYFLGLDLALAMGPGVVLTNILMDDKSVWTGTTSTTAPTVINIDKPNHWGGYKEGGGWVGTARYYPGSFNILEQPLNAYITDQVGADLNAAYLGTSHIVFEANEIGESAQLRKMTFVVEKYTNSLGLTGAGKIGEDMNPAEAIYQIMTDTWSGMGVAPIDIDIPGLQAIGETLLAEGNGVSILVTSERTGETLVTEIMRQIDAIAYQSPETGKITFKLIRNDYTVASLPTFDEDDVIKVRNFSRTGWDEVVSQVKVSFPQRDRESAAIAVSQDMATVNMLGRIRSSTLKFPFCYSKTLANELANRERSQLSVPLFRMTLEMNRNAYALRPGDVFKLDWPEYGFSGLVMRVQKFDLGELINGKIVVDCLQDSFALATTVFAEPADSGWVAPLVDPTPVAVAQLVEVPYWFTSKMEFPVADGLVNYIPFVAKPGAASTGFDFLHGVATGDLTLRDPEGASYFGTGTLATAYDETEGLATGLDSTVGLDITGATTSIFTGGPTLSEIRVASQGLLYMNGEWLGYTSAVDGGSGNWTLTNIYRGLLGTTPKTHSIGTRVYEFNLEFLGNGALDDLAEAGTLYYKLLDRAGRKSIDERDATELSVVHTSPGVADRPVRPANLKLDGARVGIIVNTTVDRSLTWVNRKRDATQIAIESDATETPDIAETYDVEVWVGGILNATLSATGQTSPYTVPFSATAIDNTDCEFRVYAHRTAGNLRLSEGYGWLPFQMDQIP
jgi:hypothetical protein